ncbi:MAG TPA: four helix bundle protein [Methylococcales bacterium]
MKKYPLRELSFDFAMRAIATCNALQEEQRKLVLSKQLLRSGTSIGANADATSGARSLRDFLSKGMIYSATNKKLNN